MKEWCRAHETAHPTYDEASNNYFIMLFQILETSAQQNDNAEEMMRCFALGPLFDFILVSSQIAAYRKTLVRLASVMR